MIGWILLGVIAVIALLVLCLWLGGGELVCDVLEVLFDHLD